MRNYIKYQIQKLKSIKQSWPTAFEKTEQIQFGLLANKGAKKAKTQEQIQIPRNKYVFIENFLQMFYNSTSQNGRPNGQNLAFVTGALGSGKTSMIRQSLQHFKKRKNMLTNKSKVSNQKQFTTLSTPQYIQDIERTQILDNQYYLILQLDFSNNFIMKSQAFFHHIHTQIISQILKLCTQVQKNTNSILLDCNIIKQIVLAQNSSQYVFIFVKDLIFSILNNCGQIKLNTQGLAKLENLNQRIIQVRAHEFFYGSQFQNSNKTPLFQQLIALISQNLNLSDLKATILLFMSTFKRVQYEHRPIEFKNTGYQTGIQTTTFLFSIMNYLCGFGSLNKKILNEWINAQTEVTEQKEEKKNKKKSHKNSQSDHVGDQKYKKYYVGKGNHIDVILSFSHLQKLSCYKNPKFCSWLDNLLIQLHNQSNLRTHFPVLLQLSDNYELQLIQKLGRLEVNNPTVVQIPGYTRINLFRYGPSLIFNEDTLKRLRPVLGRTQSLWNQATLQLSKGVKMQDIITGKAEFMRNKTLQIKFNNKINRLYLYPQNLPYIDNNTLKYHILQYLIILDKCQGFMKTWYMHHNMQLFSTQLFNQLYKEKLLYESYYNTAIDLVDMRNLIQIRSYVNNISFEQRVKYRLWKYFQSPHNYFFKELKYREDFQVQHSKHTIGGLLNERSEYMVREYFGGLRDYKITYYQNVVKKNYKV